MLRRGVPALQNYYFCLAGLFALDEPEQTLMLQLAIENLEIGGGEGE